MIITENESNYRNLEEMSTLDILSNINKEDKTVAFAVEKVIPHMEKLVDLIIEKNGPAYRAIDLKDFADSLEKGEIKTGEAKKLLYALQEFLDKYIHGWKNQKQVKPEFPPKAIRKYIDGVKG